MEAIPANFSWMCYSLEPLHNIDACHVQGTMTRWFTMPLPPQRMQPVITALTSNFSHVGLTHLAINMLVLRSWGSPLNQVMPPFTHYG